MAKSKDLLKYVKYVAALFGLVSVFMILCPAIKYGANDNIITYSGLNVVFGLKETGESILGSATVEYFKFSFMALLAYLLPLAGVVIAALNCFGKKSSKLMSLIATACFAVGAIFMFCLVAFAVPGQISGSIGDIGGSIGQTLDKQYMSLGIGAIIGAIASIIAAACQAADVFLNK